MITDKNNRWHYLAVKSLPALFRGITSNHYGDFYCLNCFHSYRTFNKLERHERICNNHDCCRIDMPKENEKIKHLPGEKSLKDYSLCSLECLLEKVQSCQNHLENSYTGLSTNLQDTNGLQYTHLMIQKIKAIFIGKRIVLKSIVKT